MGNKQEHSGGGAARSSFALHGGTHVLVLEGDEHTSHVVTLPPAVTVPSEELTNLDGTPRHEKKKQQD